MTVRDQEVWIKLHDLLRVSLGDLISGRTVSIADVRELAPHLADDILTAFILQPRDAGAG